MSDPASTPSAALYPDVFSAEGLLPTIMDISLTGINLLRPVFEPDGGELEDFNIEYLNPAGQRMLGLSARPGGTITTHFPHTKENGVLLFYRRVFESGQAGQFKINYQRDGLNNFFHLSAQRNGPLLVVSFTDTSDQDRSAVELALRESQAKEQAALAEAEAQRQRLYDILMQLPANVATNRGPDLVFDLVNPRFQHLFPSRTMQGRPIREALPELVGQPHPDILNRVYQTGEPFYGSEMETWVDFTNTGRLEKRYFTVFFQATRDSRGRVDGLLNFSFDVTEQVLARQQVQELNEQLERRIVERTREAQQAQLEANRHRQRLERLFMQAPAAICILAGPDLVYELVNPGYQQLFPERQLLGKPILEALPEIADNSAYRTFREVYDTGKTHEERGLLIPLYRPEDGVLEDRYFNFIQQARYDRHGRIDGVLVFAFEVTSQVEAQKSIEASARQLRLITDALPVLIGYLDRQEKYRFANQAYQAWFNVPPESLLGRPVRDIVGDKAYQGVKEYIGQALAGERVDFEARMPYRGNFTKHIHTSYVPDIREGKVAGFYTLVLDITEQVEARQAVEESERQAKALAEELAAANQELRTANQLLTRTNVDLDNFIYTASHDLKAPIVNIEGLMEVLLEQMPPESAPGPSQLRITDLILDSIHRFKRTINHLTDITKLQKENSSEATLVNVAAVIKDVQLDLAPAIQAAQARVEVAVDAQCTLRFSEKNLRSIIYNLLSNALKYRSPERELLVRVQYKETAQTQVLTVQDNGLGIAPDQQHKLFGMFKRLHNHVEGTGLGLYMLKRIVDNAGGKIEVESAVGEGSMFRVHFQRET